MKPRNTIIRTHVLTGTYRDSVELMSIAATLEQGDGIVRAGLLMGTAANLAVLDDAGLLADEAKEAAPSDLVVAVAGTDDAAVDAALALAQRLLSEGAGAAGTTASASEERVPATIAEATAGAGAFGLAMVSTPGQYATAEALKALKRGLHVFLFSDNVAVADEIELKRLAARKGLLLMGPDCGTAILDGVALGFTNVVRSGSIGVVGASGTGVQEVTTLIDRGGAGVSHAIGVGGRDLSNEVGGVMMRAGIERLINDGDTEVIVLVSKPPAADVARVVMDTVKGSPKPVVACFLGGDAATVDQAGARFAPTLADAASQALDIVGLQLDPALESLPVGDVPSPAGRHVRGLFTGGTLASEARWLLQSEFSGRGVTWEITDLGADEYTVGRPHPMIDPRLRNELVEQAGHDDTVGVVLLDVVLGYGSHVDPAGVLAPAVSAARSAAEGDGRTVAFVASICGTDGDPQDRRLQERALRQAGVILASTNASAARLAGTIADGHPVTQKEQA